MALIKEFKEFALKGNVIDLAVAVIIAAAFGKVISSIVNDILDEPLGPMPSWTRSLVFASIPIAVLAVLLRRQLARGAVEFAGAGSCGWGQGL